MSAMSDFLEDEILNLVLRGIGYSGGSTVYAALYTTPTDDSGGGTEVAGGGYIRTVVTAFGPASGGVCSNSANVQFPAASASWGTVTHFALWDAPTGGNMLFHGELTAPKTINAGDTFVLPPSNITITMD